MKNFLVIYEKKGESLRVEVAADSERGARVEADRLLRRWGENPMSYKRPAWGRNKINTVREIAA